MTAYIEWLRARIGHELIPLAYATALVRDPAGRLLFQRRSDFDWWGLPGGVIEPGESPTACAVREVREETGLAVEVVRLTGVYTSPRYDVLYPNGDRVQQVTLCYECRVIGGDLKPDGREVLDVGFFPAVDLPPRPIWYSDMAAHALGGVALPYFDPPESVSAETRFPTLMSLRTVVGHAPLIMPGAAAAVFDERGHLLLHQRGDTGLWSLPAGALDAGETMATTAVRETEEETGIVCAPVKLAQAYGGYKVKYPNGDVSYPVGGLFLCRLVGGALRSDGHETLAVGFFPADALPPTWGRMQERIRRAFAAYQAL